MKLICQYVLTLGAAVLCGVVMLPDSVLAQNAVVEEALEWFSMPGTAVDVSINSEGQAYVVGPDGTPWRWDAEQQRWRRMSGTFVRITAAEGNRPWAIDREGVVYRYNGLWWENKDTDVVDVAADALGNVYISKFDGSLYKWNPLRSEWRRVEGSARRLSLDGAGNPWVVTQQGRIRSFDGNTWTDLPGQALDIAVNGDGRAVIVDREGRVRQWIGEQHRWDIVPGVSSAIAVAAAPNGAPWVVTRGGRIMAKVRLVSPQRIKTEEGLAKQIKAPEIQAPVDRASVPVPPAAYVAPANPNTASARPVQAPVESASVPGMRGDQEGGKSDTPETTIAPTTGANVAGSDPAGHTQAGDITFVNTRKTVSRLAIGSDGSVFGVVGGDVVRWSNARQRFEAFPGSLVRIAVDPDGNPWGISAVGRVFRHDGQVWRQIAGATAADIAISGNGVVIISDASNQLYKLNSAMTRFEPISGRGVSVAVASDGTPWTIRSDRLVQRCDSSPCTVFGQKALSLSIGPDDSVWIVSDRNQLMRLSKDGKSFDVVRTPGHTPVNVAVGPSGYPWVVSDTSIALASTFFDRDESGDRAVAASTAGDTVGSGASSAVSSSTTSAFTFSKNMRFESVSYSTLSSSQYAVLASDFDGVIWAATNGGSVDKYSVAHKKFIDANLKFTSEGYDILNFDIAPNGDIWAYTLNPSTGLFRERNNVLKEYTVSGLAASSVAVSPDGTVFADFYTGGTHYIYSKESNSEVFKRFSQHRGLGIAAGPGNDLWIIQGDNYVYQWTGSTFVKRPASGQKASRIAIGKTDGTVYIIDTNDIPRKWNSTNESFDKINNITGHYIAVDDEGRPWINTDATPTIKRGLD